MTRADLKKMIFVFFVSAIAFALGTFLMGVLLFRSYEENADLRPFITPASLFFTSSPESSASSSSSMRRSSSSV